jgi:AcrR family transcriptional regulator
MTERFGQNSMPGKEKESAVALNRIDSGAVAADADTAKRRQIIDGAREVFLALGFDATSMGEIARKAGVSKGTLYVYFDNKEQLFETIVHEVCLAQARTVFALDPADPDLEVVLTQLGRGYVQMLCRPEAMSPFRTVIAISERMPEIGRTFYETGPGKGVAALQSYLDSQVAAGTLVIEDTEIAAAQFLDSCLATLYRPMLYNAIETPTDERIDRVVGIAVRSFLAAYRRFA